MDAGAVSANHGHPTPGVSSGIKNLSAWRIFYVSPYRIGRFPRSKSEASGQARLQWRVLCERLQAAHFNALLIAPPWRLPEPAYSYAPNDPDAPDESLDDSGDLRSSLARLAALCAQYDLALFVDVLLDRVAAHSCLAAAHPHWYGPPLTEEPHPERPGVRQERDTRRLACGRAPAGFLQAWITRLNAWAGAGVAGFCLETPHHLHAADCAALLSGVRTAHPECHFFAWTPGMTPEQLAALRPAGFEGVFSSVPWWDYRSAWLAEEDARLRAVAPVIAMPQAPIGSQNRLHQEDRDWYQRRARRALWSAAVTGDGIMVPAGFEAGVPPPSLNLPRREPPWELPAPGATDLWPALAEVNNWLQTTPAPGSRLHLASGTDGFCTVLARGDHFGGASLHSAPEQDGARLLLINPDDATEAVVVWAEVRRVLPDGYTRITPVGSEETALAVTLPPAGCALYSLGRNPPVRGNPEGLNRQVRAAMRAARIAIENVTPLVDGGLHAVKCALGEEVRVEADLFMDGHDKLRAALRWRPADSAAWKTVPMEPLGNDRWAAAFMPERLGPHQYAVCGWLDVWSTFRDELKKKQAAGQDLRLDVCAGVMMLRAARQRGRGWPAAIKALDQVLPLFDARCESEPPHRRRAHAQPAQVPAATPAQIEALLAESVAAAMQELDDRPFEHTGPVCPLVVDRMAARYGSWYEVFPRSQSGRAGRHGTFDDVVARLPAIRDMGFDVLYFPPIHPIGLRNRKGRNNSLRAGPDDPGSPYAIGSAQGGHTAVHPQLGTLQSFQALVHAARRHGLEIALDFAIQCAPDHPWLTQHPDWFAWRADGSLRYAENPPKKYEDIVNVDFYGGAARVSRKVELWRALRDVVLFWIAQGVHTFRVDNPHTKPLPFWEWMIADVRSRHPEVIFLSEAFTRPRMMYRLAKIGFSQSYTYFTWRHGKAELIDYLTELSRPPVADFFRPHFFVNTPDINPKFLQVSGRPGFLIRAALAATASGLWGVYNGFELCEAQAVPGTEEYLDSEKYQIREWDWNRPGHIVAEIARLNQIRRANPALQTQRGFSVLNAANDQVLCFWKATPDRSNVVMVAISLDPYAPQSSPIEIPLWAFRLPDEGALQAENLIDGSRHTFQGKHQRVTLTPDQPYLIWRLWARP